MIKIEVLEATTKNISGIGKASGKPFSFDVQEVFLHNGVSKYPKALQIIVEGPHPVGVYQPVLDVDRNGKIEIADLIPATARPVAKTA